MSKLVHMVMLVMLGTCLAFLAVVVLGCERSRVALSVLWCKFGDDDHAHVLDVGLLVEVKDHNAVFSSLEAHNLAVADSGPVRDGCHVVQTEIGAWVGPVTADLI